MAKFTQFLVAQAQPTACFREGSFQRQLFRVLRRHCFLIFPLRTLVQISLPTTVRKTMLATINSPSASISSTRKLVIGPSTTTTTIQPYPVHLATTPACRDSQL